MRFRPCIDLKDGKVVQIVGGSLNDDDDLQTMVNFTSEKSAADFAALYREDNLVGGHIIALGSGNSTAAVSALNTFPGGLQYGGGVTADNAIRFLEAGASHVIVTSWVFRDGLLDQHRLEQLLEVTGPERLVLDLSCRRKGDDYFVVTDRWQRFTKEKITPDFLQQLSASCAELLVHGVDVEGRMQGIEAPLISLLGEHSPLPVTYAGGIRSLDDMEQVRQLGNGRVDATIGSALDIFGGTVAYRDVINWSRQSN